MSEGPLGRSENTFTSHYLWDESSNTSLTSWGNMLTNGRHITVQRLDQLYVLVSSTLLSTHHSIPVIDKVLSMMKNTKCMNKFPMSGECYKK